MDIFIVTVKEAKNPDHDPKNKLGGPCPHSAHCTDRTGAHHSFLVLGAHADDVRRQWEALYHVTRVEKARWHPLGER